MSSCGKVQISAITLAAAGLGCMLAFAPARAQPAGDPDASFEQRYVMDGGLAPTFTRPEVIELLGDIGALVPTEETAAAAPMPPPDENYRSGSLAIAEPKGPAKVLKDLLTTPVKELLVSRAEAGPEVPPPPPPPPQATPPAPAESPPVPVRAADPLLERPPADRVAAVPAPMAPDTAPAAVPPRAPEAAEPRPDPQDGSRTEQAAAPRQEPAPTQTLPAPGQTPSAVAQIQPAPSQTPPASGQTPPAPGQTPPALGEALPPPSQKLAAAPVSEPPGAGQSQSAQAVTAPEGRRIAGGRATWYEHPGRTASGEPFDPNRLTAAHHTLPFGTRLRVVNEATDRSVVVRINDRIPRKTKIVIDLSRAGAKAIGLDDVGPVALYRLGGEARTAAAEPAVPRTKRDTASAQPVRKRVASKDRRQDRPAAAPAARQAKPLAASRVRMTAKPPKATRTERARVAAAAIKERPWKPALPLKTSHKRYRATVPDVSAADGDMDQPEAISARF